MKLNDLIQKREQLREQANGVLLNAEDESDLEKYDNKQGQIDRLTEQINNKREERDLEKEQIKRDRIIGDGDDDGDWYELGEMVRTLTGQSDKTTRDLEMKKGSSGGFLVPDQFRDEILEIGPQDAVIRPRATVIPAGDPADSEVTIPAVDQSNSKGVYSGVTVEWIEEGGEKPETEPSFRRVSLKPNEVAAHVPVTNKLLRNSQAVGQYVRRVLQLAIAASEDHAFLQGDGVGKPYGIIGHASTIEHTRDTANEVDYDDIVEMYARFMTGGAAVWIASRTILPQLMTMTDAGSNLVWQPSAREGAPGALLGIPVLLNERAPTLGDTGDLILADLSYYLIKDGSPLELEASEHVHFTKNKTVIKASWNTDGQSWLTTPLLPEHEDSDHTVSPFVVLEER